MQIKAKTFDEWVNLYEHKTGEEFIVFEGFRLAFDPVDGFFLFKVDEKDGVKFINIAHTCVTSWKWVIDSLRDYAIAVGATYYATATKRNEKAYAKLTGGIRKPEYDYDGYKVFVKEVV
jgi:hypothetical protein